MAQLKQSPGWVSCARPPHGKWRRSSSPARSPQPGKENQPSPGDLPGAQSHSKIPVLSRSRLPPDCQPLRQAWGSQSQKGKAASKKPCTQTCPFNLTGKGDKDQVMSCADVAAGPELRVGSPSLLTWSQPRGPLEEIQPGAAARKNAPGSGVPSGKEVGTVEFVADPVALASILSNVGLANSTLGVARKPSLARRVPLRGSRGNSVHASGSTRTLHGSLYVASGTPALRPDPARTSCFSRLAAKDAGRRATQEPARHRGLLLQSQQIQALSATLRDLGARAPPVHQGRPALQSQGAGGTEACQEHPPPIATATRRQPARSQEAGGAGDRSPDGRPRAPSDGRAPGGKAGTGGRSAASSSAATRRGPMGASQTEEFVPDPDALASVLSNVGLSHAALGPTGKLSLAQRVPVKGLRGVLPSTGGGTTGSRTSLLGSQGSIPPKGDFGRTSCRSVLGLKGLEAPDAPQAAQPPGTPRTREISRYSPFGSARRVPVTQPQSSRGPCFSTHRLAVFPCTARLGEPLAERPPRGALQTPARWAAGLSPQQRNTDPDESALPWEKIAVRLFGDGESQATAAASARKAPAQPAVPQGCSKAQRVEVLARLLRQEVEGTGSSSALEELHRLLAARAPAPCPPSPGRPLTSPPLPAASAGLKRLPSPSSCCDRGLGTAPPASPPSFSAAGTTLTFSTQRPVCSSPLIRSLRSPRTSRGAAEATAAPAAPSSRLALAKQRLGDLLGAPQRFHEACLDEECAFYAGRAPGSQPHAPRCCSNPVASLLEAQETRHFLPIPQPESSDAPLEAGSARQPALPRQPLR
ncbi:tastin isoform X2 [Emydura macquarii macquarii]|uniref:tastin isoform X2 n=1 Tax=Emydura macquarii macquarii TaxID=1129001 RepID=UPI003529F09A